MSKVITFSRVFPSYHPKKGEPTYFVEKILRQIGINYLSDNYSQMLLTLNKKNLDNGKLSFEDIESFWLSLQEIEAEKSHTIRGGNRFKANEMFSPRCWFGKPYNAPQIIFADDIEIKNTWNFEIKTAYKELPLDYDADIIVNHKYYHTNDEIMKVLAKNDGLSLSELLQWFKYPNEFSGPIICWNENINY